MDTADRCARGFSLIELLVVVAVIAVLIGVLLPALSGAKAHARRAACGSNLHQMALATTMYLHDHDGSFWEYVHTSGPSAGAYWWFGFEPGGPGGGTNRPLDLNQSVLRNYLDAQGERFQCPDFPYDDGAYFAKFDRRAASLGYNWLLSGLNNSGLPDAAIPPHRLSRYAQRTSEVFVFADAIHFDAPTTFNEGHYLSYQDTTMPSGYAHFRHHQQAQYLLIDGHVAAQSLTGGTYKTIDGAAAGNLAAPDGSNAIYGY